MIVIGGDAIVDLIDRGQRLFEACPGGSTLNCALAAGQLGSQVLYVSTLSADSYGDLLANRLAECHVKLRANARSSAYTSLAVVSLDETNQPSYAFYREGTADRDVSVADIVASFPETMSIFHVGSCALIPIEDQDAWLQVVMAAKGRGALISIDPNCRPSMTQDPIAYRVGVARFFHLADLIKCSDKDLEYLHPEWSDRALATFIRDLFTANVRLHSGRRGASSIYKIGCFSAGFCIVTRPPVRYSGRRGLGTRDITFRDRWSGFGWAAII